MFKFYCSRRIRYHVRRCAVKIVACYSSLFITVTYSYSQFQGTTTDLDHVPLHKSLPERLTLEQSQRYRHSCVPLSVDPDSHFAYKVSRAFNSTSAIRIAKRWPNQKNRTPNNRPLSHSLCVFEHMSLSARSRLHWCSFSCGSRDHLLLAYPCKKPAQLKHLCLLDGFVVSGFPIYIYVYAQVPFSERGWSLMEDAGDAAQETNIRLEPVSSPIEHVSQQLLFSGVPHDHPHRQPENYYPQAKTVKKMNLWLDRFTLETSSQSA